VRAATNVSVMPSSPIPDIGQKPPKIDTDTIASVGGDIAKIDTRLPSDDMHKENFADAVGKQPVARCPRLPSCASRGSAARSRTSPCSSRPSTETA
jgi:hypothetical protein